MFGLLSFSIVYWLWIFSFFFCTVFALCPRCFVSILRDFRIYLFIYFTDFFYTRNKYNDLFFTDYYLICFICACYLLARWAREGRRVAVSLSLDKAVLQDRQNEIDVQAGADDVWCRFSPTAYMQVRCASGGQKNSKQYSLATNPRLGWPLHRSAFSPTANLSNSSNQQ